METRERHCDLKHKDNISFADARKRVQPISDPSKNSYATVTQTPPQSARPLQPWARNIRPPTDFQTEVNFLKYILNYCLTRLDAIGNEQIPVNRTAATEDPVENTPATNTDDTTVLNTNTVASNDENNVDMQYVVASATPMKSSVDDDSSDEESRPKRCLLLAPQLVCGQTQLCQKRGKEEICQGSPPSLPPLNQGNRGPMGDVYLLFALQVLIRGGPQGEVLTTIINPLHHQNPSTKKVMWKQQLLQNHKYGSQLHNPVEL